MIPNVGDDLAKQRVVPRPRHGLANLGVHAVVKIRPQLPLRRLAHRLSRPVKSATRAALAGTTAVIAGAQQPPSSTALTRSPSDRKSIKHFLIKLQNAVRRPLRWNVKAFTCNVYRVLRIWRCFGIFIPTQPARSQCRLFVSS